MKNRQDAKRRVDAGILDPGPGRMPEKGKLEPAREAALLRVTLEVAEIRKAIAGLLDRKNEVAQKLREAKGALQSRLNEQDAIRDGVWQPGMFDGAGEAGG